MGLVIDDLDLFVKSNQAILDFPFPDDNLLIVKILDIEHASVPN